MTARLYQHWLTARCFLVGLRIAWVSALSVLVGLLLFTQTAPAQDILLEATGFLTPDLIFWSKLYLSFVVAWVLPVFISARWMLAHFEEGQNPHSNIESIPSWVTGKVPVVLALLCFVALWAGQLLALQNAPVPMEDSGSSSTDVFVKNARNNVKSDKAAKACSLNSWERSECVAFARDVAVVHGANLTNALGDQSRTPYVVLGVLAFWVFWFRMGPRSAPQWLPSGSARTSITGGLVLLAAAFLAYYVVTIPAAIAPVYAGGFMALSLIGVGVLAWLERPVTLWWLGAALAFIVAVLVGGAYTGIVMTELRSDFSLAHLYLLPFITILLASLAGWALSPRSGQQATRTGEGMARLSGNKAKLTGGMATVKLVAPFFYALLIVTVLSIFTFVIIHPLQLAPWVPRGLLLPIVLGLLPVAAMTWISYWSIRLRFPLVLGVVLAIGILGAVSRWFLGDYYAVRMVHDAPPRENLDKSVQRWAKANSDCDLRVKGSCPSPIIVTAAGGASRAAFHAAGVIGSLIDGGRLAPIKGHRGRVFSAAYRPGDNKYIATASGDRTVRIWDARSGRQVAMLVGHGARVHSVAFDNEGKRIVTASDDNTARVWDISALPAWKELKQLKHKADVNSAEFSPDGSRIVTTADDKLARIWDAKSFELLAELHGHSELVYSAVFDREGKRIVTASFDDTAKVWDVSALGTDKEVKILKPAQTLPHQADVNHAVFHPGGKLILTGADDKMAHIWDADTGAELVRLNGHKGLVYRAGFNAEGTKVVTASWDWTSRIWDLPNPEELEKIRASQTPKEISSSGPTLNVHEGPVNSAAFNRDGTLIVTASHDRTARVWDAKTGERKEWADETYENSFGRQLFAISAVSGGALGSVVTYAAMADSQRKHGSIWAASGMPPPPCVHDSMRDPDWFAARARIRSRPAEGTPQVEPSEDPAKSWKTCLQLLVSGDFLSPVFLGLVSNDIFGIPLRGDRAQLLEESWEVRYARMTGQETGLGAIFKSTSKDWKSLSTLAQPVALVRQSVFEADPKGWLPILLLNGTSVEDGRRIVTSDVDLVKPDNGRGVRRVMRDAHDFHYLFSAREQHGHTEQVYSAAVSPDSTKVITASDDKTARIWDAGNGQQLAVLVGHQGRVNTAAFSPDGKRAVTASWDGTAKIWDVSNLVAVKELIALLGHTQDVNSATFSADGRLVVTASDDTTARIWDANSGKELAKLEGHDKIVFSAAFDPYAKRVVTASYDHTAKIWDISDLSNVRQIKTLPHTGEVNIGSFSPDGQIVLTGANDRKAHLWEASSGIELSALVGHTAIVFGAGFNSNGTKVVTGSWDNTARVWDVSDTRKPVEIRKFKGHLQDVNTAVFSPDGRFIVTASDDKAARIWDPNTGFELTPPLNQYETLAGCNGCDVRLSTAATMSARFPIISPPGRIVDHQTGMIVAQVVDGGYHENFGATSAMELARVLRRDYDLEPVVILINNEPQIARMECVMPGIGPVRPEGSANAWFPTLLSPLDTTIGTRTARGSHAAVTLCSELEDKPRGSKSIGEDQFAYVSVARDRINPNKAVTVSWWMSRRVQKYLDDQLSENSPNMIAYRRIAKIRK